MSRHRANKIDSVADGLVGVAVRIETMVQTACEKAVDLLKSAPVKLFSDLAERVKTVENRLVCIELKCHLSTFQMRRNGSHGRVQINTASASISH